MEGAVPAPARRGRMGVEGERRGPWRPSKGILRRSSARSEE